MRWTVTDSGEGPVDEPVKVRNLVGLDLSAQEDCMSEESKTDKFDDLGSRRDFVKKASKAGLTAPATIILLSGSTIPKRASARYKVETPE